MGVIPQVYHHTCISMRHVSIRLIIHIGSGVCGWFVSNEQIYGCLKKKKKNGMCLIPLCMSDTKSCIRTHPLN